MSFAHPAPATTLINAFSFRRKLPIRRSLVVILEQIIKKETFYLFNTYHLESDDKLFFQG